VVNYPCFFITYQLRDSHIWYHSSATNRLITAKDHASVQINVADVDAEGRATNSFATYAFCGFLRKEAESDDALNRLSQQDGCKYLTCISVKVLGY